MCGQGGHNDNVSLLCIPAHAHALTSMYCLQIPKSHLLLQGMSLSPAHTIWLPVDITGLMLQQCPSIRLPGCLQGGKHCCYV